MEALENINYREPLITNIQRYSLQDGPGIRATIFLKGCPLRCPWCHNPETQQTGIEINYDAKKCTGCARCTEVCPNGAAYIERTAAGEFIRMDRSKCTGCGKCVGVCLASAREVVGRKLSTEEIIKEATADELFFTNSGGGVTISGGDPMLFPDFTLQLVKKLKKKGFHVAIETSAFCQWNQLAKVVKFIDLFLVDIKSMDPEKYRSVIKADLKVVQGNIERLIEEKAKVRVRLPIIPGFNNSPESFMKYADYLGTLVGKIQCVDILPFHSYGEKKYTLLSRADTYQFQNVNSMAEREVIPLVKMLIQVGYVYGTTITVGGLIGVGAVEQGGEKNDS